MTGSGNKFAHFRKKNRLTQFDVLAEIQKKTGKRYRQGTISSWENGKTVPDMDVLQVLASIFGVKVDDLYEKSEPENTPAISSVTLSVYETKLGEIDKEFKETQSDEAYTKLRQLAFDMYRQLSQLSHENQKLKDKLRTVLDVINL